MEQTAVEWLGIELNMLFTDITEEQWNRADELFEQAKEMEKEQIIQAWNSAYGGDSFNDGIDYYNETFKSE